MDNQQGPTYCTAHGTRLKVMRQLGWGWFGGEWIHVCVWLNPFSGHLKLSQYCQSDVLLLFSHLVMSHSATPWTTALQASLSLSQSVQSLSRVRLFVTPWTVPSIEFSRPEYWSG